MEKETWSTARTTLYSLVKRVRIEPRKPGCRLTVRNSL